MTLPFCIVNNILKLVSKILKNLGKKDHISFNIFWVFYSNLLETQAMVLLTCSIIFKPKYDILHFYKCVFIVFWWTIILFKALTYKIFECIPLKITILQHPGWVCLLQICSNINCRCLFWEIQMKIVEYLYIYFISTSVTL